MPDDLTPDGHDKADSAGIQRSEHARIRAGQGRPVGIVVNDVQRAGLNDVFVQVDDGRFIVRGPQSREHVIEADGEHVTSVRRSEAAHRIRLENGTIRNGIGIPTLEGIRDMTEEIVDNAHQESFCADLLALKSREAFPVHLLIGKRTGEWIGVRDLCLQIGLDATDISADLMAAWLPNPAGNEGYAVILFYDEHSLWSMAANYNRQRLLDAVLPTAQRQAG